MIENGNPGTRRRAAARGRRAGFSLVEIAMVVAITALLVAGVFSFFASARVQQRSSETVSQILVVRSVVNDLYEGVGNYAGLNGQMIASSRRLPQKYVTATGVNTPYGTPATIQDSGSVAGGTSKSWSLSLPGLPFKTCLSVAMQEYGIGFVSLSVNGTSVQSRSMTLSEATGACTGTGSTVTLTFD